jgi:hypothetical protein
MRMLALFADYAAAVPTLPGEGGQRDLAALLPAVAAVSACLQPRRSALLSQSRVRSLGNGPELLERLHQDNANVIKVRAFLSAWLAG